MLVVSLFLLKGGSIIFRCSRGIPFSDGGRGIVVRCFRGIPFPVGGRASYPDVPAVYPRNIPSLIKTGIRRLEPYGLFCMPKAIGGML